MAFIRKLQFINTRLPNIYFSVVWTRQGGTGSPGTRLFRWCRGDCVKLTIPGNTNGASYLDGVTKLDWEPTLISEKQFISIHFNSSARKRNSP